jgi:hypothetical protein
MSVPKRGDELKNGVVVIDAAESVRGIVVVLAMWKGEFVTWEWNEEDGYGYAGNYFVSIVDAAKDYERRLKEYYLRKEK